VRIACACSGAQRQGSHLLLFQAPHIEGKELAIKIFKTSILIFKDRDKYVTGVGSQFFKECCCMQSGAPARHRRLAWLFVFEAYRTTVENCSVGSMMTWLIAHDVHAQH
jgi:hypothetical protein